MPGERRATNILQDRDPFLEKVRALASFCIKIIPSFLLRILTPQVRDLRPGGLSTAGRCPWSQNVVHRRRSFISLLYMRKPTSCTRGLRRYLDTRGISERRLGLNITKVISP